MTVKKIKTRNEWLRHASTACLLTSLAVMLSGCGSMKDRIAGIGQEPPMSQIAIADPLPKTPPGTLSLPMPEMAAEARNPNSLWTSGRQTFFKDQRANKVGDILTVMINIEDKAEIANETKRNRSNTENMDVPALLGLPGQLTKKILPEAFDPSNAVDVDSDSSSTGKGTVNRDETIDVKVAATITKVLPNGNLVIYGRQEVRVNYEVRELQIAGVIRPEDIGNTNSISYEKIAEARISYGGRGQITDVQQPRYGQQFWDIVAPF